MRRPILFVPVFLLFLLPFFLIAGGPQAAAGRMSPSGGIQVVAVSPAARSIGAPVTGTISVEFDRAVDPATIDQNSFWAFGKWSGTVWGNYSFTAGDTVVTLTPNTPFSAGEQVMVILSHDIKGADSSSLRSAGYSYQFWVAAGAVSRDYSHIQTLYARNDPGPDTQSYGGVGTDLNNDGYLDLSIVNEDTADVRVFMNKADGSGTFDPFLEPPNPVNTQASPSEPSDFNRDGNADLAVANIATQSISILLGNGDGTYAPQQEVTVGPSPRGIAVLDMDGDGDTDIANTNFGTPGSVSVLLNDGNGVFGAPTFFEGGGNEEWPLGAADMNEDMILDLVVGLRSGPTIALHLGNGDATFSAGGTQNAGGLTWMLNIGDVNGDGHEDVVGANGFSNTGSVLLGDGTGQLASPVTYPTDPFTLATDIGDADGDGDLDWVTSSFSGNWLMFENLGDGTFQFDQEFVPTEAASCALLLDVDNDGYLDLALIDEIADEILIYQNVGDPPPPATPTPTLPATTPTTTTTPPAGTPTATSQTPQPTATIILATPTSMPTDFPNMLPIIIHGEE